MKTSSFVLRDSNSMLCINQKCEDCKDFPKLTKYNAEFLSSLKCSDSCFKNSADCTDHKVKCLKYQRAPYDHKGVTKKKIQLVDKFVTLPELTELLNISLKDFPWHCFNASYTKTLWNQVYANLRENSIVKIQDFSENYTCLLPQEIQSLHWTQNQCTVYPVVALRKVNDKIKEDYFVVIKICEILSLMSTTLKKVLLLKMKLILMMAVLHSTN